MQFLGLSKLFWGGLFKALFKICLRLLTEVSYGVHKLLFCQYVFRKECRNRVEDPGLLNNTIAGEEMLGFSEYYRLRLITEAL